MRIIESELFAKMLIAMVGEEDFAEKQDKRDANQEDNWVTYDEDLAEARTDYADAMN